MPSTPLHRSRALLLLAAALAACGEPGPTGSGTAPAVAAVANLVPGETATLTGRNLSRITSLAVDGQPVALSPGSDAERTFVVPVLRPCETDGRPVRIAINGTERSEPLRVRSPTRLEVGQSRLFTEAELAAMTCLQLAAADEDYALTALHVAFDHADRADTLLTFRTWTESAAAPQQPSPSRALFTTAAAAVQDARHAAAEATLPAGPLPSRSGTAPVPFDPGYSTASPGDTVRFVEWRTVLTRRDNCFLPREQIPTYPVVVAAVSGQTVVAVDARLPNAAAHLSPPALGVYRDAVRLVDPVLLPAMRATFDRDFQPPAGGGGRRWMIVTSTPTALAGDGGTRLSQSYCPLASEMVTMVYPGGHVPGAGSAPGVASTYIHEYAHNAYSLVYEGIRGFTTHGGWIYEAWPELAADVAARISLGQPAGARAGALGPSHPHSPVVPSLWARMLPSNSPWGPAGMYVHASSLLLYARERRGDADYTVAPTLFGAYVRHQAFSTRDPHQHLANIAAAAGTDPVTLLDEWALAHATDDLVAEQAARSQRLPQLGSWSTAEAATAFGGPRHPQAGKAVSRTVNTRWALRAGPGSYDAVYLLARQGKGISLEVTGARSSPVRVRLTRLR
ncbi:MAG: hypothetical protein AB1941_15855 [Gemmatimonadota bacterium]